MICLYLSTETWDLVSAVIRWVSLCAESHVGFIDTSTMMTFSAKADGKGIAWRKLNKREKILILKVPRCDEALKVALTREGEPYGYLDILGMILHRNWLPMKGAICDVLVFWAFQQIGQPLLNHKYIPVEHLYPAHVLLSQLIED